MLTVSRPDRCANPFKTPGEKGHKGKSLRNAPQRMLQTYPQLSENSKVCCTCIQKFYCKSDSDMTLDESSDLMTDMEWSSDSISVNDRADNLQNNNIPDRSTREIELEEMLDGLKEKFKSLDSTDPLRLQILTIAPSSWSTRKLAREFDASRFLAAKAKNLKLQRGVLANTTMQKRKCLPQETIDTVLAFYNSDMNGKLMPGKKDFVSVIIEGERIHEQKRLLFLNLSDLYSLFKVGHPNVDIGFSTFCKLRPKHCILPGAPGTHSVCVCTVHQNVVLMLDAIDIQNLTKNTSRPLASYNDCLKNIICKNPKRECYLDECHECPGTENILEHIRKLLNDSCILHVEYSTWTSTDRSTLLKNRVTVDEFLIELDSKLKLLKPHSFISKEQSLFVQRKKENLKESEVLVMFDFAENYSYVCQNAPQAFHFNNDQCTIFTVIYYYKINNKLQHKSSIFLTNSLKHDTGAVYSVQTILIPEIKKDLNNVKKIIYMTDGAKQHFKNRYQIANLIHHKSDFNIEAEWHYFATAHGKSAYDGLGAVFKRGAYTASLTAKPNDSILTPDVLFKWAKNHFKKINMFYFDKKYHEKMKRKLNKRFENAPAVPQILKNHGFIVDSKRNVFIKRYSNDKKEIKWAMYKSQ